MKGKKIIEKDKLQSWAKNKEKTWIDSIKQFRPLLQKVPGPDILPRSSLKI